jgi:Prenyltransferase and squalene oxidase repeat
MMLTANSITERFDSGIASQTHEWSLLGGETRALDVVNHVLRCVLQLGYLEGYLREFEALAGLQHEDGGWSDLSSGRGSGVRNTCFSARNLIRANRTLGREELTDAVERAVRFVIALQDREGFWPDTVWGPRDATSSGMGLLLYVIREDFGPATGELHEGARAGLDRAARHLELTQEEAGYWHDPSSYEQPVGPTAHLLPKLVLYKRRRAPAVAAAINYLVDQQEKDGSWDSQHVDHTCDAARALLLTQSVVFDERLNGVVEGGVSWLVGSVNADGLWSEHPGQESSLLLTCDVLDCFSKYEAHARGRNLRAFWE